MQGSVEHLNFQALVEPIVTNAYDAHIWEAVLDRVDALSPPPAQKPFHKRGSKDHAVVAAKKDELFDEVKNSLFRAVDGFREKFFGTSRWGIDSPDGHQMYKSLPKEHRNGKWKDLPNNAEEHAVLKWFFELERTYLLGATNNIHTTNNAYQFEEGTGQVDIYLQKRTIEKGGSNICFRTLASSENSRRSSN
ncbi:hypothetical protein E4U57_004197 [Claviceps arundinis]|uniref:Fungal-type protein kinase domain-containing protein n=1 Tax=Claviceps arundinis TaxID=1623583 RepID=A0ABQ7P5G0_9HYPO|nr:hypothetical protein E4U57_004197 [Claviceps arundinis]